MTKKTLAEVAAMAFPTSPEEHPPTGLIAVADHTLRDDEVEEVALRPDNRELKANVVAPSKGLRAPLLALFVDPGPAAKLTNTTDAVDFHAKRTGRIEPELARLLLQRYGNFVSRHALPHDFAEFEVKGS